jgi:sugar O-acyltransferase (sialic acid O-acetyltransferase NeuD family)
MTPTEYVLWGATGQAKVLREALGPRATVVALFDNDPKTSSPFPGVSLYHGTSGFEVWKSRRGDVAGVGALVAIGGSRGRDRVEIQEALEAAGLVPMTVIHPTAFVAGDARIGAGSQVLAQAAVCVESVLGRACIVNTAATVDHECVLGDGVHVAPGAHLAGEVRVGDYALIGAGAVVLPRLHVGEEAIVGAGAVVTADVEAGAIVVGNPARRQ